MGLSVIGSTSDTDTNGTVGTASDEGPDVMYKCKTKKCKDYTFENPGKNPSTGALYCPKCLCSDLEIMYEYSDKKGGKK